MPLTKDLFNPRSHLWQPRSAVETSPLLHADAGAVRRALGSRALTALPDFPGKRSRSNKQDLIAIPRTGKLPCGIVQVAGVDGHKKMNK